jgi:hypothetical protein
MEPEQLIGGIVVALIFLFNLIGRLMKARAGPEEPEETVSPTPSSALRQRPSLPDRLAKHRVSVPVTSRTPHVLHAPAVGRTARAAKVREEFQNRRTLRQAVVFMTLLGPCRGLEQENPSR